MKTLIIARHAKSSWDNPEWTDFERPLNKRGFKDAPMIAEILKDKKIKPDLIYSSTAQRAITTAKIYSEILNFPQNDIIQDQNIYEQGNRYIIDLIKKTNNKINTIIVFGHNPTMTSLSTYFSGEYFDNVPTSGTVCIDFDFDKWKDVDKINGKLRFFEYPKKYKNRK